MKVERWTNPSVRRFAGPSDPVEAIIRRARDVVLTAMDNGWTGPPFDPIALGLFLHVRVIPRGDIQDARTVPSEGSFCIEYNPSRPRGRVRYSIAHEIAHTLFPDCSEKVRYRAARKEIKGDEWQLEALCNIAAAEFLLPIGTLGGLHDPNVDKLLHLRREYDVSTEAVFIRTASVADSPCAVFGASRVETGPREGRYRVEYLIASRTWGRPSRSGAFLAPNSVVAECSAIGYTAKRDQPLVPGEDPVHVECVGIPPYPGSRFPRVVGILTAEGTSESKPSITYLKGNALDPRGEGRKLIAHVVNDGTANWGGHGFAQAIKAKWPKAQDDFREWATGNPQALRLGNVCVAEIEPNVLIASLVSQKGYGPSTKPRIRYAALRDGLVRLGEIAAAQHATVHMPRIGCGQAGGSWPIVQELIAATLLLRGVPVVVYDLPRPEPPVLSQAQFELTHP